ncbi:MAG: DMT family transporter [Candidatus Woesearchaeota archaeon]
MKEKPAIFYAIITILLWSTVAAVAKLTLKSISSTQLILFIAFFSTAGLLVIIAAKRDLKKLKSYKLKEHKYLIFLGFLSMFLYNYLFFTAIEKSTAVEANIINYTWPMWIILFSIFILKEKASTRTFLGIGLSFIGVLLVITKGSFHQIMPSSLYGGILALCGGISWGLFSVLSKKQKFEPFSSMFYYSLYGFIFALILAAFRGMLILPGPYELLGAAYLGAIATGLAFAFWIKALAKGNTHFIANLAYLVPFLALVFIYFLTGEGIFFSQIIGLAIIVAGILIQSRK